jgi:hypothetical protein
VVAPLVAAAAVEGDIPVTTDMAVVFMPFCCEFMEVEVGVAGRAIVDGGGRRVPEGGGSKWWC